MKLNNGTRHGARPLERLTFEIAPANELRRALIDLSTAAIKFLKKGRPVNVVRLRSERFQQMDRQLEPIRFGKGRSRLENCLRFHEKASRITPARRRNGIEFIVPERRTEILFSWQRLKVMPHCVVLAECVAVEQVA